MISLNKLKVQMLIEYSLFQKSKEAIILDTYLSDMLYDVVHPSELKHFTLSCFLVHDDIELGRLVRVGSLVPSTVEKIVIVIRKKDYMMKKELNFSKSQVILT